MSSTHKSFISPCDRDTAYVALNASYRESPVSTLEEMDRLTNWVVWGWLQESMSKIKIDGFYTLVLKTVVLCRGFVRPYILPSFPDLFLNALRYQFESWYIHSVGGTTWRVHHNQVPLTYFTAKGRSNAFCNHGPNNDEDKSFTFSTLVALSILSDISFVFHKSLICRTLGIIFLHFGYYKIFGAFCDTFGDIDLKLGIYIYI